MPPSLRTGRRRSDMISCTLSKSSRVMMGGWRPSVTVHFSGGLRMVMGFALPAFLTRVFWSQTIFPV